MINELRSWHGHGHGTAATADGPILVGVESVPVRVPLRQWSRREEIANSLSHACGFLAAVIGAPFLLMAAMEHGAGGSSGGGAAVDGARAMIGLGVFALTTMLLYLSSAVHHWLEPGPAKDFFEVLDHAAIFLMIAGTYTPFAMGVLWGPWGWLLLGVIWPMALFGVALKARRGSQHLRRLTILIYVLMGWFIVIAAKPLMEMVPRTALMLLLGGGLAYTGGLVFYVSRRIPYHHLAWHLAVIAGTAMHFAAVLECT